jgi:hypothetical protein
MLRQVFWSWNYLASRHNKSALVVNIAVGEQDFRGDAIFV